MVQVLKKYQIPIEWKWQAIFKVFQKTDISCTNISKMVEFAMSLPGTSAPVERVFSIMGNIWSAERGKTSSIHC
jgi:hypothetical protein